MNKIILTFAFTFLFCHLFGQSVEGDWYGTLVVPGGPTLHLVFHITKNRESYVATMDSPDQGSKAFGLHTDTTTFAANKLSIVASQFNINFTGNYISDSNKIFGTFTQGPARIPLNLSREKPSVTTSFRRPQDPVDFPYKREEVIFTNPKAGNHLAGTITLPLDSKVSKIVILITGSGPQNRDEELTQMNHRPFLVWSDWLTRQGIAVLRYDDRGVGQSTGEFKTATSADFADDADAAVDFIKSRADLKNLSIGLMGHSEGGMIAPIVAINNKSVHFIVLLAAPGVPITELLLKQTATLMQVDSAPDEAIKLSLRTNEKIYTLIKQNPGLTASLLKEKLDTLVYKDLQSYPKTYLGNKTIPEIIQENSTLTSPWFRYFVAFNPAEYLTKITCPVLALGGTLDVQVNSNSNLTAIKESLQKAGNKKYEIIPLEGLNHLFQKANTGAVSEYVQISETVNPLALKTVSDWINQLP